MLSGGRSRCRLSSAHFRSQPESGLISTSKCSIWDGETECIPVWEPSGGSSNMNFFGRFDFVSTIERESCLFDICEDITGSIPCAFPNERPRHYILAHLGT